MDFGFISSVWPAVADRQYEQEGLGGAEAALVMLGRALARRGHGVTVYGETYAPGVFNGVTYVNLAKLRVDQLHDVLVLVKVPYKPFKALSARRRVFWLTDLRTGDYEDDVFPFVDRVLCMSDFHVLQFRSRYGSFPDSRVTVLDLGVQDSEYFADPVNVLPPKDGQVLVYCSMPDRGLAHLARLFPKVRETVPSAELVITSDFSLYQQAPNNAGFRDLFHGMPGVRFLGKVPRSELVGLQSRAKVMAYPCTFPEGFCIAAVECMAVGAVPVTTDGFALSTTVANGGILLRGAPGEAAYDDTFVANVTALLKNDQFYTEMALRGRERVASRFLWSTVAQRFEDLVR